MVRQWQTLFYKERYSQTIWPRIRTDPRFRQTGRGVWVVGLRCEREEDVGVINQARAINDRPAVIDFAVGADAQVAMVRRQNNDEIKRPAASGRVDVINQARAINDRPVVIDFVVGADAQVWPMVAAGTSNDEIQAARGIRPLFDDPEEGHA